MNVCPYILARLICKDENPAARMETVLEHMKRYEKFQDNKGKIAANTTPAIRKECIMEYEQTHNAAIHTSPAIIASGVERGVAYIVNRASGGWCCGYWGVPQSHPLHGEHWSTWALVLRVEPTYDSEGLLTGKKLAMPLFDRFNTHPDRPRWWVGFDTHGWCVPHMAVERAACAIARWGCIELADYAVRVGVEGEEQP